MLRTGATRQSESLMAYESLRRTAAAVSARHHHLRHLQENNDNGNNNNDATTSNSHLFVQSLVFFAMMVAVFIVVWLVTKVICRALLQFGPSTTNGVAHQFHHRSGGANHNDNDQHHVGSANDHTSLRWTEQEMRQLQSWGIPLETLRTHNITNNRMRRNLVVMLNDGASPEETAERRAFLEHALMDHTYEGPADDGAAAAAAATETDSNIHLQTDAESSAICCPICLDEFQTGDRVSGSYNRRCHHKFHHECILDWLVHDDTCPCCRQSFLEFIDDEDDATAIDDESKTATATPPAAAASTAALASPSASEEQAEITTTALVVEGDGHSRAIVSESRAIGDSAHNATTTSNDEDGGTYLVEEPTPEVEQSRQDVDWP